MIEQVQTPVTSRGRPGRNFKRVGRILLSSKQTLGAPATKGRDTCAMSDRKKYHLDKRAQDIIAVLIRDNISPDQLLSTAQLAVLFGVSVNWLEALRLEKEGPKWIVLSPRCVRYKMSDVLAWLKARARSTREAA
jgi:predicted DNA-binding transcriptional regulator AlpA